VKVAIVNSDERLFPDMSATVYFLPAETPTAAETPSRRVFCESEAIGTDEAGRFVWIADDADRLQRQEVATGPARDGRTEIISGLSGGERVIIAPPGVRAGQRMKFVR
jgi:multidrug efflux pump subunit AcrA (membrane-fusion protein)